MRTKRLTALLLAILMIVTLVPQNTLVALAAEDTSVVVTEEVTEEEVAEAVTGDEVKEENPSEETAGAPVVSEADKKNDEEDSSEDKKEATDPEASDEAEVKTETAKAKNGDVQVAEYQTEFVVMAESTLEEDFTNDELLEAYFMTAATEDDDEIGCFSSNNHAYRLEGHPREKYVYDNYKTLAAKIAAGSADNSLFSFSLKGIEGYESPYIWGQEYTLEELGVDGATLDEEGFNNLLDDITNAYAAGFDLDLVSEVIRRDCPYEMYWGDLYASLFTSANIGYSINPYTNEVKSIKINDAEMIYCMRVNSTYAKAGYVSQDINPVTGMGVKVNTTKTKSVSSAATKAKSIVSQAATLSDKAKLDYFKTKLCELNSYNHEAAATTGIYGDPWQLIYMFDGDPNTNVVCEGYSKSFQFLCDESNFNSQEIWCNTVTGDMSYTGGGGPHMWNIMHMEDGRNYLVDVTNCDSDNPDNISDDLFLAIPTSGGVDEGYYFSAKNDNIKYQYDDVTKVANSRADLTLSQAGYEEHYTVAMKTRIGTADNVKNYACIDDALTAINLAANSKAVSHTITLLEDQTITKDFTQTNNAKIIIQAEYRETKNLNLNGHNLTFRNLLLDTVEMRTEVEGSKIKVAGTAVTRAQDGMPTDSYNLCISFGNYWDDRRDYDLTNVDLEVAGKLVLHGVNLTVDTLVATNLTATTYYDEDEMTALKLNKAGSKLGTIDTGSWFIMLGWDAETNSAVATEVTTITNNAYGKICALDASGNKRNFNPGEVIFTVTGKDNLEQKGLGIFNPNPDAPNTCWKMSQENGKLIAAKDWVSVHTVGLSGDCNYMESFARWDQAVSYIDAVGDATADYAIVVGKDLTVNALPTKANSLYIKGEDGIEPTLFFQPANKQISYSAAELSLEHVVLDLGQSTKFTLTKKLTLNCAEILAGAAAVEFNDVMSNLAGNSITAKSLVIKGNVGSDDNTADTRLFIHDLSADVNESDIYTFVKSTAINVNIPGTNFDGRTLLKAEKADATWFISGTDRDSAHIVDYPDEEQRNYWSKVEWLTFKDKGEIKIGVRSVGDSQAILYKYVGNEGAMAFVEKCKDLNDAFNEIDSFKDKTADYFVVLTQDHENELTRDLPTYAKSVSIQGGCEDGHEVATI
ncbi:MAG: hypothetical protein HUJ70_12325, partial [Pseudobutyrivibrio sp.]|nr:hypothetical protein [Pseudobutyrivibrio sp.]